LRFNLYVVGASLAASVLVLSGLAAGTAGASSGPSTATPSAAAPAALGAVSAPGRRLPGLAKPAALPPDAKGCPAPTSLLQEQCQSFIVSGGKRATGGGISADAVSAPLVPADLRQAYGVTSAATSDGTGKTVAVVDAWHDPTIATDLRQYRADYGLPACASSSGTGTGPGCLTILNQNGAASPLPSTPPTSPVNEVSWEFETAIDVEMVSAICPNCHIDLFEANTANLPDLGTAENSAAVAAKFVSNSWASTIGEYPGEYPGESVFDTKYFNHPGVAITVASGDYGYGATYPGSSQLVTSVGGTYLNRTSSGTWTQTVWDGQGTGLGTGTAAGCSSGEPEPAWGLNASGSLASSLCANRTQNDVAAVADAPDGVQIVSSDPMCEGFCQAYGTSVAAPIIAAMYALAGTPVSGTYPASYLYQDPSDLTHITSGSDGTCESSRQYLCNAAHSLSDGYNGPTGLGTPDGIAAFRDKATGDTVSVINPGSYDLQAGLHYSLPAIKAYDSASGQRLTYSASGLPAGLSVNSANGVISGTLTSTAPVTATVHVTVKDGKEASSTVSFRIVVVKSLAGYYYAAFGEVNLDLGGKCLDDTANRTTTGNKIEIWSCNGGASQQWAFYPGGAPGSSGRVEIHGKCLDITGNGVTTGDKIALWTCGSGNNQKWMMLGSAGELYNPTSGKCLDDPGSSTTNGKQLDIAPCTGAANQAWLMPNSPIRSGVTGKCVDDHNNGSGNGTAIVIWGCNGSTAQKFRLGVAGLSGYNTIQVHGKCLDVKNQGTTDGYTVLLEPCSEENTAGEVWELTAYGSIENAYSQKCLADPTNSATNGRQLEIEDCYGLPGEVWAVS
jgi:hypothetical protein